MHRKAGLGHLALPRRLLRRLSTPRAPATRLPCLYLASPGAKPDPPGIWPWGRAAQGQRSPGTSSLPFPCGQNRTRWLSMWLALVQMACVLSPDTGQVTSGLLAIRTQSVGPPEELVGPSLVRGEE